MYKSCIFGAVLTVASTMVSASFPGDGEKWHVAWFDEVASKAAKYEAVDRADAELFIHTRLHGINLATGGPACTKIQLLKTKDGDTHPVETFSVDVKTAVERINKPAVAAQATDKVKALEKEGWLNALARNERKVSDALQEFKQRLKNDGKEVSGIRNILKDDAAEIGEKELKQVNNVIANYNRIATEIRAGLLSESFSDLQAMKPLNGTAGKTSAQLARERLLTVQAKLEEIGLRLEQRELANSREQLRAEIERIGQDKEAGLDVRRRELDLEAAVNAWKSRRDDLQRKIETHSSTIDEVFTARQATRDLAEKVPPSGPK